MKFLIPAKEVVKVNSCFSYVNTIPNVELCTSLEKKTTHHFETNTKWSSLIFHGCNCTWIFDSEAQRDSAILEILSMRV